MPMIGRWWAGTGQALPRFDTANAKRFPVGYLRGSTVFCATCALARSNNYYLDDAGIVRPSIVPRFGRASTTSSGLVWLLPYEGRLAPIACYSCGTQLVDGGRHIVTAISPARHPLGSLSTLLSRFSLGSTGVYLYLNNQPGAFMTTLPELLSRLKGLVIEGAARLQDGGQTISVTGYREYIQCHLNLDTLLAQAVAQVAAHTQTLGNLSDQRMAVLARIVENEQKVVEVNQKIAKASESDLTKDRLGEFFSNIPAVKSWRISGDNRLEFTLWPVKLYRILKGGTGIGRSKTKYDLAVIVGPHTVTLQPNEYGKWTSVTNGPHPHWTHRPCHGEADKLAVQLLEDGSLLQYINLLLDLRRGYNEKDIWAPLIDVIKRSWQNYTKKPADFEYVEDGLTGEMEVFWHGKPAVIEAIEPSVLESALATG